MKITDNGRALVASPDFAAGLIKFMQDYDGPRELGADHVCRRICLGLCEVDPERGPALDSLELENFVLEYKSEVESAAKPCVEMLSAMGTRIN